MGVVDIARGMYVRSPRWVRALAAPLLGFIPEPLKLGPTYRRFRSMIQRGEHDPSFVAEYRTAALREILRLSKANSMYYRELLGHIDHNTFEVADLSAIPVLTKDVVRENPARLLVVPREAVDSVSTSGSSGTPLEFFLDKERSVREWAFVNHIWARIGYRPGHRRAVLRGVLLPDVDRQPWQYDAALRELRLSPFHLLPNTMDMYLKLISRHNINFIHGYPSAISMLAAHSARVRWQPPASLMGILPISETMFSHQREQIRDGFGPVSIMPFYGLSEKVAIAGEVFEQPDVYEFEPLYGITELVDEEGAPIETPGQVGRIVSTGLISLSMPLIRYDTGDTAQLVQKPSAENGFRLRVRGIRSRWGQEFLVANSGALISMTAINVHSKAYARVREFQFYQDEPGLATLRVAPMPGQRLEDIEPLVSEIQRKTGSGISFQVELVESCHVNGRGKRGFIEQRLDLSRFSGVQSRVTL